MGWKVLFVLKVGRGVFVLKNMYLDIIKVFNFIFYVYVNGDIFFMDILIIMLLMVLMFSLNELCFLMVIGRRINVDNVMVLEVWDQIIIIKVVEFRGILFSVWGEDYFIMMKNYLWKDIFDVIVGRWVYDNWFVFDVRRCGYVVDVIEIILVVYQMIYCGNYEGYSYWDRDYNYNLLVRIFRRFYYVVGKILCIEFIICYNFIYVLQIQWRNFNKECYLL